MKIRGIHIYWAVMIVAALLILGGTGKLLHQTGVIFPPKVPQNLAELEQWPEDKLHRLNRELGCNRLPWASAIPEDLLELKRICDISTDIWVKKYRANKMKGLADDARDKLKHLHKNPKTITE